MGNEANLVDFETILFQDLSTEISLRQMLEHLRLHTGMSFFILSLDCRPVLYSADQLLMAYFPDLYESGEDVICYTGAGDTLSRLERIFEKDEPVCLRPHDRDPFYTVFYPVRKSGQPACFLVIKFQSETLLSLATATAPILSELCGTQLSEESGTPPEPRSGADATVARELIIFDSPASGNLSIEQFKLQYDALLNSEKMNRFRPPFAICAFKMRGASQANSSITQALAELEEHFPNSFSITSCGVLYAFLFDCHESNWAELENFSYQFQLCAGVSDLFDSLEDRHYFKKQASELLEIGEKDPKRKYVYRLFDNYTQLLLCNAAERFGVQTLVLSDVQRVIRQDAENGTSNLDTLRQYLRCFSTPTATAKALFIDRGTLHYRLQKLSELIHTDLEDSICSQAVSASIWLGMRGCSRSGNCDAPEPQITISHQQ